MTSRYAASSEENGIHFGFRPDEMIIFHHHNVGTSPCRVDERGMTDEFQRGCDEAKIYIVHKGGVWFVKCTYRRSSLVSMAAKKVVKSIIVSSSHALALEEKGTKTHVLACKSVTHAMDTLYDITYGSTPLSGSTTELETAASEPGFTL
jgi:hypothetical protein